MVGTITALVIAFAVGLTAVGAVAFFMAKRYEVAFVCNLFALFLWLPQMLMDINEPLFVVGDLLLGCYCLVIVMLSEDEAVEDSDSVEQFLFGEEE
ncbi:hypothetical protein [Fibrobacter sp.]|uniref:hypothetical protein n=1 Tax=Fibrobacter sp. TaxID=35828 RepID=UPI003865DF48